MEPPEDPFTFSDSAPVSSPQKRPHPAEAKSPLSAKRPRPSDFEAGEASDENRKQISEEIPSSPASLGSHDSPSSLFKSDLLTCMVCYDFPPGSIFQCSNGHLMCGGCCQKILDSQKPNCPMCRVRLSRDHPIKNRFAQLVLSNLPVSCPNLALGCSALVKFGQAARHAKQNCPHRRVKCGFFIFGCDFNGKALESAGHLRECRFANLRAPELLASTLERQRELVKKARREGENIESQAQVARLLSRRCRDVTIRDVLIDRDEFLKVYCSKTFKAVGQNIQILITEHKEGKNEENSESEGNGDHSSAAIVKDPEQGGWLSMQLKIVSKLQRKFCLELFVLPGPALNQPQLPVTLMRIKFSPDICTSHRFPLPFNKAQAAAALKLEPLNFRLGFIDASRGPLKADFTTINGPARQEESEISEEFGSEEELEESEESEEFTGESEDS